MVQRLIILALFMAILTGCAQGSTSAPEATLTITHPLLPIISSTPEMADTPSQETFSPTPLPTTSTPSPFIEITSTETYSAPLPTLAAPTQQATSIPLPETAAAAIQFYSPGPLSRVTSPVKFYGYSISGYGSRGVIELFGEDGTLLADELLQLNTAFKWAFFYWKLDFEARGAGELGRLSLSTRDQYGRLTALQSVHLILLPNSIEIINPPGDLTERCIIEAPLPGSYIRGGTVNLSGVMRPYNDFPLIVELVGRDGSVVGSQLVPFPPKSAGTYVPFKVNIVYTISSYISALLQVSQMDERIGGMMYLYSQEVYLNP